MNNEGNKMKKEEYNRKENQDEANKMKNEE